MSLWFAYLAGLGTIPLIVAVAFAWMSWNEMRSLEAETRHDRDDDRSLAA